MATVVPPCAAQSGGEEGVLAQLLLPPDAWHLVLSKLSLKDVSFLSLSLLSPLSLSAYPLLSVALSCFCRKDCVVNVFKRGKGMDTASNDTNKPFRLCYSLSLSLPLSLSVSLFALNSLLQSQALRCYCVSL